LCGFGKLDRKDAKKYARAKELLVLDKELKSARATFDVTDMEAQ
jgi:hypothetical protein